MLRLIISGIVLSCLGLVTYAQNDSVEVSTVQPEFDFIYRELFNFNANSTFGSLQLDQPEAMFNQKNILHPLMIDFSLFNSYKGISLSNSLPVFSPFINSFSITNQASYRLNDNFTIGGNSFSANSIYNPLPLNPSIQDMAIHGASMFLQYKVSNKFKIGGSIGVSSKQYPFLP